MKCIGERLLENLAWMRSKLLHLWNDDRMTYFAVVNAAHEKPNEFQSMPETSEKVSVRSSAGGQMPRMEH